MSFDGWEDGWFGGGLFVLSLWVNRAPFVFASKDEGGSDFGSGLIVSPKTRE